MAEFPALPLFTDAYLGDTTHLTTIEHGAYLLLLMVAWRSTPVCLPDDDAKLAKYARMTRGQWGRIAPTIREFFSEQDGSLFQRRLTDEAKHVRQVRESQRANGVASALKRKGRHSTTVEPSANEAPTPSPSPTPIISDTNVSSPREVFPRPDFADPQHWKDLLANRKAKRLKNTATAHKAMMADIARLANDEWPPGRLIEFAAAKGWGAIYNPKDERNGRTNGIWQDRTTSGYGTTIDAALDFIADQRGSNA